MVEVLASLGPILDAAGDPAVSPRGADRGVRAGLRVGPRWEVAAILEGIASVAAGQGQELVAVELASGPPPCGRRSGCPCARIGRPIWSETLAGRGRRSAKRPLPLPGRKAKSGRFPT